MTSRKKFWLRGLGAILAGGFLAAFWQFAHNPTSGGAKPDNFFARRAKAAAYAWVPPAEDAASVRLTSKNLNGWERIYAEPIQDFDRYRAQNPMRPTPARRSIVLQPLGPLSSDEKWLLGACRDYCQAFFQLPTRIAAPIPAAQIAVDSWPSHFGSLRKQWEASQLTDTVLMPRLPSDAAAILGLTAADLKVPDLAFVFGLASPQKRVGVYSFARYGLKPGASSEEKIRALRRTCQVLNHETGHVFGLEHCVFYKCSMNGSDSLADSDATPQEYCPICRRKLAWNIGFNLQKRAADLAAFERKFGLQNSHFALSSR